jgi:hypothetical protein
MTSPPSSASPAAVTRRHRRGPRFPRATPLAPPPVRSDETTSRLVTIAPGGGSTTIGRAAGTAATPLAWSRKAAPVIPPVTVTAKATVVAAGGDAGVAAVAAGGDAATASDRPQPKARPCRRPGNRDGTPIASRTGTTIVIAASPATTPPRPVRGVNPVAIARIRATDTVRIVRIASSPIATATTPRNVRKAATTVGRSPRGSGAMPAMRMVVPGGVAVADAVGAAAEAVPTPPTSGR